MRAERKEAKIGVCRGSGGVYREEKRVQENKVEGQQGKRNKGRDNRIRRDALVQHPTSRESISSATTPKKQEQEPNSVIKPLLETKPQKAMG